MKAFGIIIFLRHPPGRHVTTFRRGALYSQTVSYAPVRFLVWIFYPPLSRVNQGTPVPPPAETTLLSTARGRTNQNSARGKQTNRDQNCCWSVRPCVLRQAGHKNFGGCGLRMRRGLAAHVCRRGSNPVKIKNVILACPLS